MRGGRAGRAALRWSGVLAVALLPFTLHAQELECDPGDLEVRSLRFSGNKAFERPDLASTIVTTPSDTKTRRFTHGLFGRKRCVTIDEIARDMIRLGVYYRQRGFPEATIDTLLRRKRNEVDVTFRITEGRAMLLDTLVITGLDSLKSSKSVLSDLPVKVGVPFDRIRLAAAVDTIRTRLRNAGYPRADVRPTYRAHPGTLKGAAEFDITPGRFARLGDIKIDVQPAVGKEQQISTKVARRLLGLDRGRVYRDRDLAAAQRNLYRLDAYQHVEVKLAPLDSQPAPPGDTVVNVNTLLIEGSMHSLQTSVGWGTLDCFRAQAVAADHNFLGGARQLEVTARLSKIGVGYPLDGARGLCHSYAERDLYGDTLNYYAGASFRQPTLFRLGPQSIPTFTVFSRLESAYNAYLRQTPIGATATLTHDFLSFPFTLTYRFEYGRTEASAALFCAVFNICQLADQARLKEKKRLAVASASVVRDWSDNPANPTRGFVMRLEGRHASPPIGSDTALQFNKFLADGAYYHSITGGDGIVLATRLRIGGVLGTSLRNLSGVLNARTQFIPPEERLYAGGSNTVRGFRQNELGPAVYIARDTVSKDTIDAGGNPITVLETRGGNGTELRSVPTGGNSLIVGNIELRLKSPIYSEYLQWTLFTDVGEVWNRSGAEGLGFRQLKWTPGVGIRIFSVFGAIRVDVGYNPYPKPNGPIYFDEPIRETNRDAALFCVTPGNLIPIVDGKAPESFTCPSTFEPRQRTTFWRRLTVNLSIGQAF